MKMEFQKLVCQTYLALKKLGYDNSFDARMTLSVDSSKGIISYEDQGGYFKFTFKPDTIVIRETLESFYGEKETVEENYDSFDDFVDMFEEWHCEELKQALKEIGE